MPSNYRYEPLFDVKQHYNKVLSGMENLQNIPKHSQFNSFIKRITFLSKEHLKEMLGFEVVLKRLIVLFFSVGFIIYLYSMGHHSSIIQGIIWAFKIAIIVQLIRGATLSLWPAIMSIGLGYFSLYTRLFDQFGVPLNDAHQLIYLGFACIGVTFFCCR